MVTIIITAYNVSKTLAKAIQSCLDQTYDDIEILIINDCATDNTLEVAQSFSDPRIRIINNEENLGAGMSRRIGSKEAKGDYTIFLDGDDYLDKDYVEVLYNLAKKHNADIVSSGLRILNAAGEKENEYDYIWDEKVMTGVELINDLTEQHHNLNIYLNTKLVSRKLWDEIDYSDRRYGEDTQTCFYVTFLSKTVVCTSYTGYNYIQNPNSLCHTAGIYKHRIHQTLCAKDICEFAAKYTPENYEATITAFIDRLRKLSELDLPDSIQVDFKDQLAELMTFFLQNVKF